MGEGDRGKPELEASGREEHPSARRADWEKTASALNLAGVPFSGNE